MKSLKLTALCVALSAFIGSAHAQIPVTVTTQISDSPMTIAEWALEAARWAEQVQQMTEQISQAEREFNALTGSRNLGQILNDPALRDYLPGDWQAVYDEVKNGGYSGLAGTGKTVYDANRIYDACAQYQDAQQRTSCEALAVKGSQDKGFALDAYEAAKSRINQIDQLMSKINQTGDPKAIAELQGRIAAEQANIQNEQTKLQMYAMVAAAEDKVQEQRQHEINAKAAAKRGYSNLQPFNPLEK